MRSEQDLLNRARQFEENALAEVYDSYNLAIYRYAFRYSGDAYLAEECVAETFSRFLGALRDGKGPKEYLRAYLYRIAHNWLTDTYRRQPVPALPLDPNLGTDPATNPAQAVALEMEKQEIRTLLKQLTPEQHQVIVLKYVEEWKNDEIALALEKPVGAIKALQHRALRSLRRLYEDRQSGQAGISQAESQGR
jgi:RNA polymerase sigma-70 factor (ECF subfamily)